MAASCRPARSRMVSRFMTSTSARSVPSVKAMRSRAGRSSRAAIRAAADKARLPFQVSVGFLHLQQGGHELVGKTDAALVGHGARELLGLHAAPGLFAEAAAEVVVVGLDGGEHLLHQGIDEDALEVLGLLVQLGVVGGRGIDPGQWNDARHHITSMSACRAPEALIAWRMAMRARGEMPSAVRPSTSSWRLTDSLTSARSELTMLTPSSVRGTWVVTPLLSGGGWLTCGLSAMVTVRFDCATATVETRTSLPMTMMPEFSSMTILAGWSVSITSCSMSVMRSTMLPLKFCGRLMRTVAWSSGTAQGLPMKSLMERATRRDVVKSGFLSESRRLRCAPRVKPISRSMRPPEEMRPVVGTPEMTVAASPEALKPLMVTLPWAMA